MVRSRAYARGRRAWGQDAISGERVLLRELVRDGQTGLPTTRGNYSPKHPQERPPVVFDPVALRRPAPDADSPPYVVSWPTGPFDELWRTYPPLTVMFYLGQILVSETPVQALVYEVGVYEDGVYGFATPALSSDSPWSTALPASPSIASASSAIVDKLMSWGAPSAPAAGVYGTVDDFDVPIYFASASDPLFTIDVADDAKSRQINGTQIRIPDAAEPSGGSDKHLVVVDPDQAWVYEFWEVTSKPAGGGTLEASAGGRLRYFGDGFGNPNAFASKTGAIAGVITPEELELGVIEHAIAIFVHSTDGTNVWPASGNAGATDPTDAPPCGTWFHYNRTFTQIEADAAINGWHRTEVMLLKAMSKYGAIVVDSGGASWNLRFKADASTASLGGGEPIEAYAIAQGEAGGWFETAGIYHMAWSPTIDWASHLRVLDPDAMKALYDSRLAAKRLDPVATVTGDWNLEGAASTHLCLTEETYAPFVATADERIVSNTLGQVAEVRVGELTIPDFHELSALILWYTGNTPAGVEFEARIKSGSTVLGTYTQPANQNHGWRAVEAEGDLSGVDLDDIRIEFEVTLAGGDFCNIYAAHIVAEFAVSS